MKLRWSARGMDDCFLERVAIHDCVGERPLTALHVHVAEGISVD